MTKVRELIERLEECPPEAEVIIHLETDPEFGHGPDLSGPPIVTETTTGVGTKVLLDPDTAGP